MEVNLGKPGDSSGQEAGQAVAFEGIVALRIRKLYEWLELILMFHV
jgi:hypothetical protein